MTSDRKTPGVAFWATVVVVVVLAYPISFGPACWLMTRTGIGRRRLIPAVYRPITMIAESGSTANNAIRWYATLLAPRGWGLYSLPVRDGAHGEKRWEMRWYDSET
jgi:hypothetical protein